MERRDFLKALAITGGGLLLPGGLMAGCASAETTERGIPLYTEKQHADYASDEVVQGDVTVAFAALVSPQESYHKYQNLVRYLEDRLDGTVGVVRRQTYQEVNDMLGAGEVDFGFICSLSYVMGADEGTLTGVVAPIVGGSAFYRSYLICRAESDVHGLEDLRGATFAFTDPLSYTGHLSMLKLLHDSQSADERFFKDVFYTYSHDSSIQAVHRGTVDAACVDGLIYEELVRAGSDLVGNVRVVYQGPFAGMPPVVASSKTATDLRERFARILLAMSEDDKGRAILAELGYDRFVTVDDASYDVIREALAAVGPDALREG